MVEENMNGCVGGTDLWSGLPHAIRVEYIQHN